MDPTLNKVMMLALKLEENARYILRGRTEFHVVEMDLEKVQAMYTRHTTCQEAASGCCRYMIY